MIYTLLLKQTKSPGQCGVKSQPRCHQHVHLYLCSGASVYTCICVQGLPVTSAVDTAHNLLVDVMSSTSQALELQSGQVADNTQSTARIHCLSGQCTKFLEWALQQGPSDVLLHLPVIQAAVTVVTR